MPILPSLQYAALLPPAARTMALSMVSRLQAHLTLIEPACRERLLSGCAADPAGGMAVFTKTAKASL
jgi:hypothetical protein